MDSDEEDACRMKKKIGAKKKVAGYNFESDAQKKKKRVKKIMVVVDNDDENSSKKPKSKKKNKEIVPTRRSHRQAEKRTKNRLLMCNGTIERCSLQTAIFFLFDCLDDLMLAHLCYCLQMMGQDDL